jgi:hypothetical protein
MAEIVDRFANYSLFALQHEANLRNFDVSLQATSWFGTLVA